MHSLVIVFSVQYFSNKCISLWRWLNRFVLFSEYKCLHYLPSKLADERESFSFEYVAGMKIALFEILWYLKAAIKASFQGDDMLANFACIVQDSPSTSITPSVPSPTNQTFQQWSTLALAFECLIYWILQWVWPGHSDSDQRSKHHFLYF